MAFLPSLRNLLIPNKTARNAHHGYKDDMETLEIWARQPIQQLIAGSNVTLSPSSGEATDSKGNGPFPVTISATAGSGGYASLTGPGQTVSPGKLTQEGNFEIDGGTTDTVTVDVSGSVVANTVLIDASRNLQIQTHGTGGLGNITVAATATLSLTGPTAIDIGNNAGTTVLIEANSGSGTISLIAFSVNMGENLGGISFFQSGGNTKQAVTGSRGGNAALASLLTALASYGILFDNSTP